MNVSLQQNFAACLSFILRVSRFSTYEVTGPGCLIVSLVSVSVLSGGPREWGAGMVAAAVATVTKSLPVTMASGIVAIWLLRHFDF